MSLLLFLVGRFLTPQEWQKKLPVDVTNMLLEEFYGSELDKNDRKLLRHGLFSPFVYFKVFNNSSFEFEKKFNPYIYKNKYLIDDHDVAHTLNRMTTMTMRDANVHSLVSFLIVAKLFLMLPYVFILEKDHSKTNIITIHKLDKHLKIIGVYYIECCQLICSRDMDIDEVFGYMTNKEVIESFIEYI